MAKPKLTAEFIRTLFHYDQDTGVFIRRIRRGNRTQIGGTAGTMTRFGYISISVDGYHYQAHRLAWLYVYGADPINDIDHIDGNGMNNRIVNLRDVTHMVNMQNWRKCRSRTGYLGVTGHQGRFKAQLKTNGRQTYIGVYDTAKEAHAAYLEAKRQLHEGCTI